MKYKIHGYILVQDLGKYFHIYLEHSIVTKVIKNYSYELHCITFYLRRIISYPNFSCAK